MITALELLWCVIGGAVLGLIFFGGLWLTLRRLNQLRHPALWISVSMLGRTAITVIGFYWLFDGQIERLAAVLVGFLMTRWWLRTRLAPVADKHIDRAKNNGARL